MLKSACRVHFTWDKYFCKWIWFKTSGSYTCGFCQRSKTIFFCQIFGRLLMKGDKVFHYVTTFFLWRSNYMSLVSWPIYIHSFFWLTFSPLFSIRAYSSVAVILFPSASLVMHVRGTRKSSCFREAQYAAITHLSSPAAPPVCLSVSHTSKRFTSPAITFICS